MKKNLRNLASLLLLFGQKPASQDNVQFSAQPSDSLCSPTGLAGRYTLMLLVWLLVLTACANSPKQKRPDYKAFVAEHDLKPVAKVHHFKMVRWQSLDDRFFILNASRNRDYLIQLMGFCHDLSYAVTLKLNQTMRLSLQSKFDSITHDRYPNQSCGIDRIYELSKEQKKALLGDGSKGHVTVKKKVD